VSIERGDRLSRYTRQPFAEYTPGYMDSIVGMRVLAPPDIEARFGLTGGHIFRGELAPERFSIRAQSPAAHAIGNPRAGRHEQVVHIGPAMARSL
jgi:phytoene dehydrogenase-like protein